MIVGSGVCRGAALAAGTSRSNPVAMTVMTTSSPSCSSITAPKMMLASGSTDWAIMDEASSSSWSDRLGPPVMFSKTPRAPSIEPSSSKGLQIARWVAAVTRLAPLATPMPITARPMWPITVRTSAKSTLTSPGIVITSAIPLIACRSTSSATLNASFSGVVLSTIPSRR